MYYKYLYYVLHPQSRIKFKFNWGGLSVHNQNIGMRTLEKLLIAVPPILRAGNLMVEILDNQIYKIDFYA